MQPARDPTPFERIGGAEGLVAFVEHFYAEMNRPPGARPIRALHPANLEPTDFVLKRYLGAQVGSRPLHSSDRGHLRLRMRHLRFSIGEAGHDAWLACTRAALSATIADAGLRERLDATFGGLDDQMRNRTSAQE